mgnify:CR=1 FL=1
MNKGDQKLRTKIAALEPEYTLLVKSETSTLAEMHRIDQIEQLIPYVRDIKWEIVRQRLLQPEHSK